MTPIGKVSRQLSRRHSGPIANCPATVPLGVPLQGSAKTAEFCGFSVAVPQTVPLSCLDGAVGVPPVPLSLEAGQRDSTENGTKQGIRRSKRSIILSRKMSGFEPPNSDRRLGCPAGNSLLGHTIDAPDRVRQRL
jgi:hypothetical protein